MAQTRPMRTLIGVVNFPVITKSRTSLNRVDGPSGGRWTLVRVPCGALTNQWRTSEVRRVGFYSAVDLPLLDEYKKHLSVTNKIADGFHTTALILHWTSLSSGVSPRPHKPT